MTIYNRALKISTFFSLLFTVSSPFTASAGILADTASFSDTSAHTSDYVAIPPFLESATGKPSVILAFDVSGSMLESAYEKNARKNNTRFGTGFNPAKDYYGYFETNKQYQYDTANEVFYVDDTLTQGDGVAWDGNFMNWLTMRRVDVARKVMIGGKVHKRAGEMIRGAQSWVIEGEVEFNNNDMMQFKDAASASYSPIANDTEIEIIKGEIRVEGIGNGSPENGQIALSDKFELGSYTSDWTTAQFTDPDNWPRVSFLNDYIDPVVVAASITYDGADPSIARVNDIRAGNDDARVGFIEWKNSPDNHGADDTIFFMVAEKGCHDITMADASTVQFCAGTEATQFVNDNGNKTGVLYSESFDNPPAVFTGLGTYKQNGVGGLLDLTSVNNNLVPDVATRTSGTGNTAGFDMMMTSPFNNANSFQFQSDEEMHWIAIEKSTGTTLSGSDIEIADITGVDHDGTNHSFSTTFSDKPFLSAAAQTQSNDGHPYFVRVGQESGAEGGSGWTDSTIRAGLQAHDDGSLNGETISYLAASATSGPKVRVLVNQEPKGLVQDNDASINFGLSVYNYDHMASSWNNIINGNKVHGQTMQPCYSMYDEERLDTRIKENDAGDTGMEVLSKHPVTGVVYPREYICVPTGVHAPNDKIVQVIEDYPMIWGTTPIAESMIEMARYIHQDPAGALYDDAANDLRPSFDLGNDWDPYYDQEQGQTLECKSVFILNFNDGAPYRDYDVRADQETHLITGDYFETIVGDTRNGENEVLDSVALALRANDCRSDLAGDQGVVSYFVYAALDDENTSGTALRRMMEAAARGGFSEQGEIDNLPTPMWPVDTNGLGYTDFHTYSNLDPSLCPETEWDGDGNCVPDTFYLAKDGDEIASKLNDALSDILERVASGGAASVVSTSSNGDGTTFISNFVPTKSIDGETVRWYGEVEAWMIDDRGLLRNDGNNDGVLDDYATDQIMDSCYDVAEKAVRMKLSTTFESRPTADDAEACSEVLYNIEPLTDSSVHPLWSADDELAAFTDAQVIAQRGYTSGTAGRHIFTALPDNTGELTVADFMPATFTSDFVGMLDTNTTADAEKVVNFVRGEDQVGMRNRKFGTTTKRLGDIIYSTPVAVGKPSENLNLLYDDGTYNTFFRQYRDRRSVVYVGGNDGMLHAFNGGWYDKNSKSFLSSVTGSIDWDLGQEMWAYVPYNVLPHLKYLTRPDYGLKDGDHAYFVDQTPYIFDAQIFASGTEAASRGQSDTTNADGDVVATHPEGWGTLLVVGFRSGGGTAEVFPDPSDQTESVVVRPSYLVFDITDPEQAPKLLTEFSHENLGMSMSVPTAMTAVRTGATPETDWFMMLGSGASSTPNGFKQVASEQNAHLFMFNLKTLSLQSGFGTAGVMDLGATNAANSFVGDISAADFDLDVTTNAAYFGTTQGLDTEDSTGTVWPDLNLDGVPDSSDGLYEEWSGKLFRMRIEPGASAATHQWAVDVMYNPDSPIVSRPAVSFDENLNRWLYFGTGRFFTTGDAVDNDDGQIVGIKEPRSANGEFIAETTGIGVAIPAISTAVVDVTDAVVIEETGALSGVSTPFALPENTVQALDTMQSGYDDATQYLNGWKKDLDLPLTNNIAYRGERAMGSSVVLGGFVLQSTYAPENSSCSVIGAAQLYALRFTTGTAWYKHALGDTDDDTTNVDAVLEKVTIGKTPSSTPAAHLGSHRGDGDVTIITPKADMSMRITEGKNFEGINSKETSWREL